MALITALIHDPEFELGWTCMDLRTLVRCSSLVSDLPMADIVDAGGGSSQCRTTSHTLGGVPWQGFTIRGIGGMIFIESGLAEGRARMRLCQVSNLVTYYLIK